MEGQGATSLQPQSPTDPAQVSPTDDTVRHKNFNTPIAPPVQATAMVEDRDTPVDELRDPLTVAKPWMVQLHVVNGPTFERGSDAEILLGRYDPQQPHSPVIDLEPYGGRQLGVSRRHARLDFIPQGVTLTDLESENGTRLNGRQLSPYKPAPVYDGDGFKLGYLALVIEFLYRRVETVDGDAVNFGVHRPARGTVLVLEKAEDETSSLARLLRGDGWCVLAATDAASAKRHLHARSVQVFIVDLQTRRRQSIQLYQHLEENPDLASLPVLTLTRRETTRGWQPPTQNGVSLTLPRATPPKRILEAARSLLRPAVRSSRRAG